MSERRLEELEVKVAFVEHHLAQLDELVRGCVDALDGLQREIRELREERSTASERGGLLDEVPPHHGKL